MKKIFSLLTAIVVLASAFSFSASKAQAAGLITFADGRFVWGKGIVFLFDASEIKNKDLKGANIFAGSDYHKMYCSFNEDIEQIVCVVSSGLTEFAGQTGVIYLAGQIFYVTIPDRALHSGDPSTDDESCDELDEELCEDPGDPGNPGNPPEACIPPDVLGADVEFEDSEGFTTLFVPGETLQEVTANATQMMLDSGGFWEAFQIASSLECGFPPQ